MNFYPFHLGDYAAHTAHLTPLEDIAYRRILDLYYLHEQAPEGRPEQIARLIRMREHTDVVATVLAEFFTEEDGGSVDNPSQVWRHARCDQEIEHMHDRQAKARASGRASAQARYANAERPSNDRSTDVQRTSSVRQLTNTNTNTIDINTPPTPPQAGEGAVRFSDFWEAWPKTERKHDRARCLTYWRRHGLDELADAILADVRTKRTTTKWQEGYIEAPLVYLRGKRWTDGVVPESQGGAEPLDWRATWRTIAAKGVEVGVGDWSEDLLAAGKVPAFPIYRQRVEKRVAEIEAGAADAAGQNRIAAIVGGMLKTA